MESDVVKSPAQVSGFQTAFWITFAAIGIGFLDMPYGYYLLLRVTVATVAAFAMYLLSDLHRGMTWLLGGMVVLYNPIFPVDLGDKAIWTLLNIASLCAFWKVGRELRPRALSHGMGFPFERAYQPAEDVGRHAGERDANFVELSDPGAKAPGAPISNLEPESAGTTLAVFAIVVILAICLVAVVWTF